MIDPMRRLAAAPLLTAKEEIILSRQVRELMELKQLSATLGNSATDQALAEAAGLTVAQVRQRLRAGRRAKDRMVSANVRLVIGIAKRYAKLCTSLTLQDLVSEGMFGLNRAAELFDATRGYKFSTYAYPWVSQFIRRATVGQDRLIRIPIHTEEAWRRFRWQLAAGVNDVEVAAQQARANLADMRHYATMQTVASLDKPIVSGEVSFHDILPGDEPESSYLYEVGIDPVELRRSLDLLTEQQRSVICRRFGIGCEPQTLQAIASTDGTSREFVRKTQRKAMERLEHLLKPRALATT